MTLGLARQPHLDVILAPGVRPADLKQAPLVMTIFLLTQMFDGLLTYWGVSRFGIDLELNAMLASLMHEVGPAPALIAAKGLACACGSILYATGYFRPLAAVAGLCFGVAVVPWVMLFSMVQ